MVYIIFLGAQVQTGTVLGKTGHGRFGKSSKEWGVHGSLSPTHPAVFAMGLAQRRWSDAAAGVR